MQEPRAYLTYCHSYPDASVKHTLQVHVVVQLYDGNLLRAFSYCQGVERAAVEGVLPGVPSERYLDIMVRGAKEVGLDQVRKQSVSANGICACTSHDVHGLWHAPVNQLRLQCRRGYDAPMSCSWGCPHGPTVLRRMWRYPQASVCVHASVRMPLCACLCLAQLVDPIAIMPTMPASQTDMHTGTYLHIHTAVHASSLHTFQKSSLQTFQKSCLH